MLESGIILPVPEAEPAVRALRSEHDPSARLGVPAHITLLYPFAPPETAQKEGDDLARVLAPFAPFAFSLVSIGRFPATAFLAVEDPQPFIRMTAAIVGRWPQHRPYGGIYPEVVPHLTVVDRVGADILNAVEDSLREQLPIRCQATEAWLICSNDDGQWRKVRSFAFK